MCWCKFKLFKLKIIYEFSPAYGGGELRINYG